MSEVLIHTSVKKKKKKRGGGGGALKEYHFNESLLLPVHFMNGKNQGSKSVSDLSHD